MKEMSPQDWQDFAEWRKDRAKRGGFTVQIHGELAEAERQKLVKRDRIDVIVVTVGGIALFLEMMWVLIS